MTNAELMRRIRGMDLDDAERAVLGEDVLGDLRRDYSDSELARALRAAVRVRRGRG